MSIQINMYAQQIYKISDLPDGWNSVNLEGGMFFDGEIFEGEIENTFGNILFFSSNVTSMSLPSGNKANISFGGLINPE